MWFCSECGKKNNGKYCTRCGTKYVEVDEAPPAYEPKDQYGMMISSDDAEGALEKTEESEAEAFYSAAALFRRNNKAEEEFPSLQNYADFGEDTEISAPKEAAATEDPSSGDETAVLSEDENVSISSLEIDSAEEEIPAESLAMDEMMTESFVAENPSGEKAGCAEDENGEPFLWSALFLHNQEALPENENGSAEFFRRTVTKEVSADSEETEGLTGISGIFSHRKPPENDADREWKLSKRLLIAVGAVVGVIFLALMFLIGSLLISFSDNEETLPTSSGIYYYVSGVKDTVPLYADKSIQSEVLAELKNGDPVEFLADVNSKFSYVYDGASEQYGYINAASLVDNKDDVDYGKVENKYANEKSLGYYYVTKVEEYLTLWENPDGGGTVKAKLECGFKVSLLEKTNDSYWYVFDYNSAERGYVRTAYLTDSESKVVYPYKEPTDKTVIGTYYVTGVKNYLPIYSKPKTSGDVRGKLNNGDAVGLIEKTTGSFWYVSGNGVYGWVSASYLSETPPAQEPAPAPDTSQNYKVTGTQEYLPVVSEPKVGASELAKIHNGDTVTFIKEIDDKFWYIKVPSLGIEGYVVKDYLTK